MDFKKWKWITVERLRNVIYFAKYCYYSVRIKLNLVGDEGFYYHMQRNTMKSILKADLEREYLIEHGLWEDPEEECEKEEREPGLVREYDLIYLICSAVSIGNMTYIATEMKEYEDRLCLRINKINDEHETETESFELPWVVGTPFVEFTIDGHKIRWNAEMLKLQDVAEN